LDSYCLDLHQSKSIRLTFSSALLTSFPFGLVKQIDRALGAMARPVMVFGQSGKRPNSDFP
jgi:hypothetical protein